MTKATEKHLSLIVQRVKEFQKVTPKYIETLLNNPNEVIWIDEEKELVCRVRVDPIKKENHVAWLLPANENRFDLYLVMAKTFVEVSHRFPRHDDFTTWARFKDGKGCISILTRNKTAKQITQEWHSLFPATQVKWRWWDDSWIISARHSDLISDIIDYLNKPRRVEYGSALHLV